MTTPRLAALAIYWCIRAFLLAVGVLFFVGPGLAVVFAPLPIYSEPELIPPLAERLPQAALLVSFGTLIALPPRVFLRHRWLLIGLSAVAVMMFATRPSLGAVVFVAVPLVPFLNVLVWEYYGRALPGSSCAPPTRGAIRA